MKYQYFIFLFIFSFGVSFFNSIDSSKRLIASPAVTQEYLKSAIVERMDRVDELKAMKDLASELGIKNVYLFGGSAAAWAHYVYWDLEREAGIGNYHDSRFDYDYTSIFRANQDMDIVIDVDESNSHLVHKFQSIMQKSFPHFQGSKEVWEVRPLRFDYGAKEKILDNPDFLAQNSDSHSTGLISITDNDKIGIRDFKEWDNPDNYFFRDVFKRKLHFYRDEVKHQGTKRFRQGLNPEIFSVIRYFTKAFQYELEMDKESLEQIAMILDKFDAKSSLKESYAKVWLEKNGKKLYQNAIDLEFAYKTMKQFELQEILKSIVNNIGEYDSLAWWMNRMPLLSTSLGNKDSRGKTAGELGIDIIAHETRSFAAYESITKSHSGRANVFISRADFDYEGAAHGDGFYTAKGREGMVGSGLTIRFRLNPQAIEGVDFKVPKYYDNIIIVLNKEALEVIPESLEISFTDYFLKLANGGLKFDTSDRGVKEKIKRKISLKMTNLDQDEIEFVKSLVLNHITNYKETNFDELLTEWLNLPFQEEVEEVFKFIIDRESTLLDNAAANFIFDKELWNKDNQVLYYIERLIEKGHISNLLLKKFFNHEYWIKHERGIMLLEKIIASGQYDEDIFIENILLSNNWKKFKHRNDIVAKIISKKPFEVSRKKVQLILSEDLRKKTDAVNTIKILFSNQNFHGNFAPEIKEILASEKWIKSLGIENFLNPIVSNNYSIRGPFLDQLKELLGPRNLIQTEIGVDIVRHLLEGKSLDTEIAYFYLSSDISLKRKNKNLSLNVLKRVLEIGGTDTDHYFKKTMSETSWLKDKKLDDMIYEVFENHKEDKVASLFMLEIFSSSFWLQDKERLNEIEKKIKKDNIYRYRAANGEFYTKLIGVDEERAIRLIDSHLNSFIGTTGDSSKYYYPIKLLLTHTIDIDVWKNEKQVISYLSTITDIVIKHNMIVQDLYLIPRLREIENKSNKNRVFKMIEKMSDSIELEDKTLLINEITKQPEWVARPEFGELVEKMVKSNIARSRNLRRYYDPEVWKNNPYLQKKYKGKIPTLRRIKKDRFHEERKKGNCVLDLKAILTLKWLGL